MAIQIKLEKDKKMKTILSISLFAFIFLAGCVDTDFINDSQLEPQEGYLRIENTESSLLLSNSLQLMAAAFDASDNEVNNAVITWKSSDESVITIDNTGLITGNNIGQSVISIMADGFESDSKIISVIQDPNQLASISVLPNSANFSVGTQIQFSAQGLNGNGQTISGINFQWNSTDQSIVSINSNGVAETLMPGVAFIYASADGIQSDNIRVEVRGQSKTGQFQRNPSTSYVVEGTATLTIDGNDLLLQFGDDFRCSNGPGLHVYLANGQSISAGGVDLGRLKSTSGAQSYRLNGSSNVDFTHVIIHCVPFNVSFGFAELN